MAKSSDGGEYDVFISYSHSKDMVLAAALQTALQRFNKPWYKRRALRIFRDETSLGAGFLWPELRDHLTASRYLILIASPESAESEWVEREVQHWIDLGRTDRLLIVLSAGTTVWKVLPRNLHQAFPDEPFFIDLSWARREEKIVPGDHRLALPIAKLAAPIYGRELDELIGDDRRQYRRTRRLVKLVIATLTVLLLVAAGATVRAVQQQQVAQQQRDLAEQNARQATARLLASEATGADSNDMDVGLLLAAQSYAAEPDSPVSWGALAQAMTRDPHLVGYLPGINRPTAVATASSGDLVVVGADDGTVTVWQAATMTRIEPAPPALSDAVRGVGFSGDGRRLVAADDAGNFEVWDRESSTVVDNGNVGASTIAAALDTAGERFAIGTDAYVTYGGPGIESQNLAGESPSTFRFGPDDTMTAGSGQGELQSWRLATGEQITDERVGLGQPVASAFTSDLSRFSGVTVGNPPYIVDTSNRQGENIDIGQTGLSIQDLVFDPTGSTLAAIGPSGITLLDVAAAQPLPTTLIGTPGDFRSAAVEAGGRVIVVAGTRGVAVWNLDAHPDLIHPLPTTGLEPRDKIPNVIRGAVSASFSHNGRLLAWTGSAEDGGGLVVVIRDLQDNKEIARVPSMGVESFSPNDEQLAVQAAGGESGAQVVDVATGVVQPMATGPLTDSGPWADSGTGREVPKDKPWTVDNGHGLGASIPADGILELWDVNRGQPVGQLPLPVQPDAASLSFDPAGQRLAVTAAGGFAYLVDVDPHSWWQLACQMAGRSLTADEQADYIGQTVLPAGCP